MEHIKKKMMSMKQDKEIAQDKWVLLHPEFEIFTVTTEFRFYICAYLLSLNADCMQQNVKLIWKLVN